MSDQEEFVRRLTLSRAMLLGYLRVMARDPHLAEDIFQETCVVAFQKFSAFDRTRDFGAWIRGIAYNELRNALRKNGRHSPISDGLMQAVNEVYSRDDSPAEKKRIGELEYLSQCIKAVSPENHQLLTRRYVEGASLKQLAADASRSAASVQVALSRLRKALLNCIQLKQAQARHG